MKALRNVLRELGELDLELWTDDVSPNVGVDRAGKIVIDLRIVPGKLAGAPHVHRTRIETEALAALHRRRLSTAKIVRLYPVIESADVERALDLEHQLQPDLALAA